MFKQIKKRKKQLMTSVAVMLAFATIATTPASAAAPTFGKWANRTQTMYVITSASYTPWSNGAAKWKNNTNFKVTATMGVGGGNYSYYTLDVNKSNVDWDGLCTTTMNNGFIVKAILNLNTHFTSQSKYTSAILAGLAGHEVGHSLGLDHTSVLETSSIMYPYTFTSTGNSARALSPSTSDITVVNNLYPTSKAATADVSTHVEHKGKVVHLEPSWAVYYEDEAALMEAADLVVKGTVEQQAASQFAKGNYIDYTTKVNVKISDVLKGEKTSKEQIIVSQMGGYDDDVLVVADHSTLLKEKQEVVLFLRQSSDGTYRPINENDGIYVLEDGAYQNLGSHQALNEKLIERMR